MTTPRQALLLGLKERDENYSKGVSLTQQTD